MKSKVSNFDLNEIDKDMPTMHGKTDIELKNVKTGLIEKFHDENTFQPTVLTNYMKNIGSFNGRFTGGGLQNLYYYLCGGLYLFNKTITVGTEFVPANNQMIGNGVNGIINSTDPVELGSYNSVDSSITANAITQIWDFTTSQANGIINCVCLGNRLAAYVGVGNHSDTFTNAVTYNALMNSEGLIYNVPEISSSSTSIHAHGNYNTYGGTIIGNYYYEFYWNVDNGIKTIKVYKNKIPHTQFSIMNLNSELYDEIEPGNLDFGDGSGWLGRYEVIYVGNNIVRIQRNSESVISTGEIKKYYEYNISTKVFTEKSFTNLTGKSLHQYNQINNYYGSSRNIVSMKSSDYIDGSRHTYFIDITNNEVVKEFPFEATQWTPLANFDILHCVISNISYSLDLVSGELHKVNINCGVTYTDITELLDTNTYLTQGNSTSLHNNPFYLATINNLQTPVEKTAAHTMKVTYTLEEV